MHRRWPRSRGIPTPPAFWARSPARLPHASRATLNYLSVSSPSSLHPHTTTHSIMSSSEAAASLSNPPQRGTLSLAFRRSVVALQSTFGWPGAAEQAEREHFDENGVQSYGSVMDLPPERRVPRPRPVKSAVRVEAKVWFANEVSRWQGATRRRACGREAAW